MRKLAAIGKDILAVKQKVAELEAKVSALKKEREVLDKEFIEAATKEGVDRVAFGDSSVGVEESIVPQVNDWDSFFSFILKKKWLHLLQRRASVTGARELWERGVTIPGVLPFTQKVVKAK